MRKFEGELNEYPIVPDTVKFVVSDYIALVVWTEDGIPNKLFLDPGEFME